MRRRRQQLGNPLGLRYGRRFDARRGPMGSWWSTTSTGGRGAAGLGRRRRRSRHPRRHGRLPEQARWGDARRAAGGYGAGKGEGSGGRRWPHRRWREAGRRGSGATVVEEDGDEASSPCRGGGRSPAGRRTGTRRRRGSVRRGQLRAAAIR